MPISPQFAFALEYVPDIDAAKHFYVDVLGLDVERAHPTFVQFKNFAIASDQPVGSTGEPELYWAVDDAGAAFEELSRKAEVSSPLREMPFGKVFSIKDPGGRSRFLIEFARERPSQAV